MIVRSTIVAAAFVIMLASPAFAQDLASPGYGYMGPYPYANAQAAPYGWQSYGYYGPWAANNPASIDNNIHTPPNH